jgi:hypothetical protein
LKWRVEQKCPHQKVNEDNPTNYVSDGTTLKASGSPKKLEETQSKSGNPVLTTSAAQDQAEGISVLITSNDQADTDGKVCEATKPTQLQLTTSDGGTGQQGLQTSS